MLDLLHFQKKINKLVYNSENQTYLLAVSGGVDSMVLAYLFKKNGYKFQIAHINYHLRNEDSNLDQKIVESFCKNNDIPFHLYEISEKDEQPQNSIQLWAREIRYRFFKKIQEEQNLHFLVTAHHLNDQLETFIINLSKASGINGLIGIPANKNCIVRPLLDFSKEEIYLFAKTHSIDFREDLSNKKTDYLRNKIRHKIVPQLLETNDSFLENFNKSISFLSQTKDFVEQKINEIILEISVSTSENIIFNKEKLNSETDFVKFEILKKYGFDKPEEIAKIFLAETGRIFKSKSHEILINRNELIFSEFSDVILNNENIIILENNFESEINLAKKIINEENLTSNFSWNFDSEKLVFPLQLRRKREGDVFYPLGFSGKKKVSKFFKDEKLSNLAKQKIWLLVDGNDDVLGILPYRQDKRFAKNEKTKKNLNIFYEK